MDIVLAEIMLKKEMKSHGLLEKGWRAGFNNRRCGFGLCRFGVNIIELSRYLVSLNTPERVRDTILHEIAHALLGPGYGHSREWKRKAQELGCSAVRCYTERDTVVPEPRHTYVYVCKHCKREVISHKRMNRSRACGKCCKKYSYGKFDVKYLLEYKEERFSENKVAVTRI